MAWRLASTFFGRACFTKPSTTPIICHHLASEPVLPTCPTDFRYSSSMAFPRVCSLGRGLVFRGPAIRVANSVLLPGRIAIPHRSFVSASRQLQEAVQSTTSSSVNSVPTSQASIPEEQRRKNARSVKVLKVPRRAPRSKVEAVFTDAGFDVYVQRSFQRHVIYANSFVLVSISI
jgi:hypothetical protein